MSLDNLSITPAANGIMRMKQWFVLMAVCGVLLLIALLIYSFSENHGQPQTLHKKSTMAGALSTDFTKIAAHSTLLAQQDSVHQLNHKLSNLQTQLIKANHRVSHLRAESERRLSHMAHQLVLLHKKPHAMLVSPKVQGPFFPLRVRRMQIQKTYFTYHHKSMSAATCTPTTCVPAGTFARAVILGGADANASVNGQSNTSPILLRLLNNGTLPNGGHSPLKGCFVIAETYGDVSSERGEVRLKRLSCVRPDGKELDKSVEGTVFDVSGKEGIRGKVVMRNGPILLWAGMSGLFSGLGNGLQQAQSTQSVSPLGSTSTISTGNLLQYGAYSGANSALGKLSNYYIKRADQYHAIVEISAGNVVDVLFQSGFSLLPK